MKKVCKNCGEVFEPKKATEKSQVFCGLRCAGIYNGKKRRKKKDVCEPAQKPTASVPKKNTLDDIVRAATAVGMSYGKYVAKYGGG